MSAVVPATGSAADSTALPADLLIAIVSFIPLRPRLLVLSIVSRRWRDVVLRSITSLPVVAPASFLRLPSLTKLHSVVARRIRSLAGKLSSSLQDLTFQVSAEASCYCQHLSSVSTLTRLSLIANPHGACNHVFELLCRNTSLTDLCLVWGNSAWRPRLPDLDLTSLHFPNLCSLVIGGWCKEITVAFVEAHAAHLKKLSIRGDWLALLHLPACHSISITGPYSDDCLLTTVAPLLSSVELHHNWSDPFPSMPLKLLKSISIFGGSPLHPLLCSVLTCCTQLTSLSILPFLAVEHINALLPIFSQLHKLEINTSGVDAVLLRAASNVTSLGLEVLQFDSALFAHWYFPHLRHLRFTGTYFACIHFPQVIKQSPLLNSLFISLAYEECNQTNLLGILRLAERQGLEAVTLDVPERSRNNCQELLARSFVWMVVRVPDHPYRGTEV